MHEASRRSAIAVINSSDDTVEMLRTALNQRGFSTVVTAHVPDIKAGRLDVEAFVREHDPVVFVYDISLPYEENWRFLQLLRSSEHMQGRRFVITTTNKRVLDQFVGETGALEIHGKPYDLDAVVDAVERAVGAA